MKISHGRENPQTYAPKRRIKSLRNLFRFGGGRNSAAPLNLQSKEGPSPERERERVERKLESSGDARASPSQTPPQREEPRPQQHHSPTTEERIVRHLSSLSLLLLPFSSRAPPPALLSSATSPRSPCYSSPSLPEPHHQPFYRLLPDSLRSWRSGDRLPSGSFAFLASQALAKSAMAKGGLERLFDGGAHLLKVSLQRRGGFDAGRLFSSSRNFWRYLMPTPDGVLLSLIGANVAVFFLWKSANPKFMRNNFMISLDNFKSWRLHTLITSAFSHSDLDHLVTNMIGLYFFGTNIGKLFGPEFLLKLYLAGALGGSIFFLIHKALIVPSMEGYRGWDYSRIPGLGASAAVNAIILLDVFLFPKNIIYVNLIIPVPAILMGALLIGTDLWRVQKGEGHISGSAHLGGAVVAALVWAGIKKGWI